MSVKITQLGWGWGICLSKPQGYQDFQVAGVFSIVYIPTQFHCKAILCVRGSKVGFLNYVLVRHEKLHCQILLIS